MAPFEADAEMAYLSTSVRVDAVVTEDSDMLAYDCKKVPFSWEKYSINPNTEKVILLCHYISIIVIMNTLFAFLNKVVNRSTYGQFIIGCLKLNNQKKFH